VGQGPGLRSWVASICLCSRSSREVRNEFKLGRSPNRTRIKFRGSSQHTRPAAPRCKSNLRIRLLDLLLFVGDPAPQNFTQLVKAYRL
jgi:hypothetical protein